jgi:hypothetical protein
MLQVGGRGKKKKKDVYEQQEDSNNLYKDLQLRGDTA